MAAPSAIPADGSCCGPCQAEHAPYTCPRCHVRFCSVPCYREHGSCARDFQTRELQLRLQGQRGDVGARRRLRDALLRLRELREPGDADPELGPDPDGADLWARLSPEHREAFQRLLSSGEIAAVLPRWRPWWEAGAPLIQEVGASRRPADDLAEEPAPVPALPGPIPPLSALARAPASPLLAFQLPNVLYGYAYALALFNGEADDAQLLPEFCEAVLDLSAALGAQRGFSSAGEALQAALQAVTGSQYPECPLGKAGAMGAVARILRGPCPAQRSSFSLAALAHLSRLLSKARRRVPPEDQPRIYRAKKKCQFLLSWVKEHEEQLALLALDVQREYEAHLEAAKEVGAVTQELEKRWGGKRPPSQKPLIEELD